MPYSPSQLLAGRQYAAQQVEDSELHKVASASMTYGDELALRKIAAMEHEAKETKEEEDKEERGEHPKLDEEEKKEASAMGMFAFEGYINKLAEAGDLIYNDPSVYIRKLAEERGAYEKIAAMADGLKAGWEATKGGVGRAWDATKGGVSSAMDATHRGAQNAAFGLAGSSKTQAGLYGAGAGALLGAGTGALTAEDSGMGALYGAGIGAAGGAGAGLAGRLGARAYTGAYGKDIMLGRRAAAAKELADRTAIAERARAEAEMTRGGGYTSTQGVHVMKSAPQVTRQDVGKPRGAYTRGAEYVEGPYPGMRESVASGSTLDLLIASRTHGILSQY